MRTARLIENRIKARFAPLHYELVNESRQHQSGRQDPQAETHFKLVLVSQVFSDLAQLQRHKAVHALLGDLLKGGMHALSLHLFAPEEWRDRVPDSPPCAH